MIDELLRECVCNAPMAYAGRCESCRGQILTTKKMSAEVNGPIKAREFWIDRHTKMLELGEWREILVAEHPRKDSIGNAIHVIEYSAIVALQDENTRLRCELALAQGKLIGITEGLEILKGEGDQK